MTQTHKAIWAAGILAGILVATFVIIHHHKPRPSSSPAVSQPAKTKYIQPTYAPDGRAVSGFPDSLILNASPHIDQSYSVPYGNSAQSTVVYDTPDSPDKAYQTYLTNIQSKKYSVLETHYSPAQDSIYATSGGVDVSVIITPKKSGSSIVVSYLNK